MLPKPGSELDQTVAEKLENESAAVPAYSTDESLADPLLELLNKRGVLASVERTGGIWYATLSSRSSQRETLATGSGRSRALAICRAVANVGRWPDQASVSTTPSAEKEGERRSCSSCGAPIRRRSRRAVKVLCSVCAWKEGKPALQRFEASRISKTGRRRRPRGGRSLEDFPEDF